MPDSKTQLPMAADEEASTIADEGSPPNKPPAEKQHFGQIRKTIPLEPLPSELEKIALTSGPTPEEAGANNTQKPEETGATSERSPENSSTFQNRITRKLSEAETPENAPSIPQSRITRKLSEVETQERISKEPSPTIELVEQQHLPLPKQTTRVVPVTRTNKRQQRPRTLLLLTLILLVLLASSTFLLAQDLFASYIYAYALNPDNGNILSQKNLGSLPANGWLSAPITQQGQVEIGIQKNEAIQKYQLLHLKSKQTTISQLSSQNIGQGQPGLSLTSTGDLISIGQQSLQVSQPTGQLRWRKTAALATKGAHRFQPTSDNNAIYSIKSVTSGEIAAYNLKDGTELWTQQLDENLEYTPPFQLEQGILYIAGEQNIYALDSRNGQIQWQTPITARTILIEKGEEIPALLTAGAQGIIALSPGTGENLWTFTGQHNEQLTPPQFYQASLAQDTSQGSIIYATGICWQLPQIEEQSWLYAINANTGQELWSQQLGTGFVSGDSSRVFSPLIDFSRQSVIIQHQESENDQHISAYDMKTGTLRWQTTIRGTRQTAPDLLQMSDGTLFLFAIANNGITALATLPGGPYFMLLAALVSIFGLFLLWLPRIARRKGHRRAVFSDTHLQNPIQNVRKGRQRPRILINAGLLMLLLVGSILVYRQFKQVGPGSDQIKGSNSSSQSQQTDQSGNQATLYATGSITIQEKQHLQWLQANKSDGSSWQSFASEGHFELINNRVRPDILLATLTGNQQPPYQLAATDPGYPNALANLFILASFVRESGQLNWQHTLIHPQEQLKASIVGEDQRYIYVSSRPDQEMGDTQSKIQLVAINQQTGNIDWRIFGPGNSPGTNSQQEKLSLYKNKLTWQVQQRIYQIDTSTGQIEWQHTLPGE